MQGGRPVAAMVNYSWHFFDPCVYNLLGTPDTSKIITDIKILLQVGDTCYTIYNSITAIFSTWKVDCYHGNVTQFTSLTATSTANWLLPPWEYDPVECSTSCCPLSVLVLLSSTYFDYK